MGREKFLVREVLSALDPIVEKILFAAIGGIVAWLIGKFTKKIDKGDEYEDKVLAEKILKQVDKNLEAMRAEYQGMSAVIDSRIEPLLRELQDLEEIVQDTIGKQEEITSGLLNAFRFRLIRLCKIYINQGCLTQDQYDQLSSIYRLYHDILGGNGEGERYFAKAASQKIVSIEELEIRILQKHKRLLESIEE